MDLAVAVCVLVAYVIVIAIVIVVLVAFSRGISSYGPLSFALVVAFIATIVFFLINIEATSRRLLYASLCAASLLVVIGLSAYFLTIPGEQGGPWTGSPGDPPTPQSDQAELQARMADGRKALIDGRVTVPSVAEAKVGESFVLTARICGSESGRCPGPSGQATVSPDPIGGQQTEDVDVGARIRVWATAPDDLAEIMEGGADTQSVMEKWQHADWSWYIKPRKPGRFSVTVHFRVLLADTEMGLVPDVSLNAEIYAERTFWEAGKQNFAKVGTGIMSVIGWTVGILAALGITAPVLLRMRRRRKVAGGSAEDGAIRDSQSRSTRIPSKTIAGPPQTAADPPEAVADVDRLPRGGGPLAIAHRPQRSDKGTGLFGEAPRPRTFAGSVEDDEVWRRPDGMGDGGATARAAEGHRDGSTTMSPGQDDHEVWRRPPPPLEGS